jgi:CheY-like chemotaxis protein
MTRIPRRILVAEDSAANRELITEILALNGYEITVADHGAVAGTYLERSCHDGTDDHGYDLVLLDIQMPVLDGDAESPILDW